jgi:hypothetical protein
MDGAIVDGDWALMNAECAFCGRAGPLARHVFCADCQAQHAVCHDCAIESAADSDA